MRGKDTKERIVEEAFALFASRGFHAVSVRDIAAAVGIKDASLYNHFSGKQAIFDAIVRDALERTRRFFGERSILFDVSDDATPYEEMNAERMHEMVLPSFRYFFEDPYMVRLRHLLVISQFESEEAGRVYRLVLSSSPWRCSAPSSSISWRRASSSATTPRRWPSNCRASRSCSCMRV